ncbi:MAG: TIGR03435 family protein [Acidobacteria bacterium]|nr:TIGR03435 family protein [Acidobacteriota bacterium]
MYRRFLSLRSLAAFIACAALAPAQKTFDVASIKPNASNDNRVMIRVEPGGNFSASGVTLKMLIGQAFGVRDHQIVNAPGWAAAERYDIRAKAEGLPDRVPPEVLRPMIRALLEDRFQLKTHTDTKELPVYALVVGKNGPKLKKSEGGEQRQMVRMGRGQINASSVSMAQLAQQLAQALGRSVIDKTELQGSYEVTLEWTPEAGHGGGGPFGGGAPPPNPDAVAGAGGSGPTIFTAVQEQLGLRLESSKGPVEILVIDNAAKPSEN